jgi:preprotein translocase subunit SecY
MGLVNKIKQAWGIEELKNRILNTLLFLLVYRLGSFVIIPGVDSGILSKVLENQETNNMIELINQFAGGAFSRASIFALGVMPYITASIVIQLLGMAVPQFQKMQKEGESGRKKMQTYTKFLTILVVAIQAPGYLTTYVPSEAIIISKSLFVFTSITIMIASTMFIMWLGDKITEKGVGNGVSLLIAVGIIANLPQALLAEITSRMSEPTGRLLIILIVIVVW